MSLIDVDLDTLHAAQQAVEAYIKVLDDETRKSERKVEEMGSSWKGKDYERFKNKWTQLTNEQSVSKRTKKELESFNSYLSTCYNEYYGLQTGLKDFAYDPFMRRINL